MKALIATVGVTLVLVGCGSDKSDTGTSAGTIAPNRQANSASTVPTANPTKSFAMGEKADVDGGTVQVSAYDAGFSDPDSKEKPQLGNVFAAVEARVCARGQTLYIENDHFRLEFPDGRSVTRRSPVKVPLLQSTVHDGQCSTGWVSFEIPENQKPAWSRYKTDYRWAIP